MAGGKMSSTRMRVLHRYLGFFLAGIMAVYAISGVVLIFRDTGFLKQKSTVVASITPNLTAEKLGKEIKKRNLVIDSSAGQWQYFKGGKYNVSTGAVSYQKEELPVILSKLTQLHKASSKKPLFVLNIFFGVSLLFFVLSAYWMFKPKSTIFKKGLLYTLAGIVFVIVILFV